MLFSEGRCRSLPRSLGDYRADLVPKAQKKITFLKRVLESCKFGVGPFSCVRIDCRCRRRPETRSSWSKTGFVHLKQQNVNYLSGKSLKWQIDAIHSYSIHEWCRITSKNDVKLIKSKNPYFQWFSIEILYILLFQRNKSWFWPGISGFWSSPTAAIDSDTWERSDLKFLGL